MHPQVCARRLTWGHFQVFALRMTAKISSSHEHGGLADRYVAAERAGSPTGAVYGCELSGICDRSDMWWAFDTICILAMVIKRIIFLSSFSKEQ